MDFVVLRVNGRDVSNATHEEAVAAFRAATEPIVVEVLRRERRNGTGSSSDFGSGSSCVGNRAKQAAPPPSSFSQGCIDAAAQTEIAWWAPPPWEGSFLPNGLSIPPPPMSPPSRNEDPDDDDGYDIEYEEVTLIRNGSDKLGLTLCYGDPEEQETEIYVGEIDPRSVAAKDGRLQEGDQILQVNGTDVLGRDQAIALFSEQRPDFTLLVARTHVSEASSTSEDHSNFSLPRRRYSSVLEEDEEEDGNDKDDATTANKADVAQQAPFQEELSETETQVGTPLPDNDLEMSVLASEFQRVILDKKAASVEQWLHQGSSGLAASPQKWDGADSGSSAYHTGGSSSASPPTLELGGRSGSLLSLTGAPATTPTHSLFQPMTRAQAPAVSSGHGTGPTEDKSTQMRDSDLQSLTSCESCRCHFDFATSPRRLPKTVSEPACVRRGSSVPDYASLYPTMYTNPQNLQHTMWLQQNLFREALARRNSRAQAAKSSSTSSSKKEHVADPSEDVDLKSQWKVKRRADGTRYITRRPARTKLLKEREQKILEERSGLTTDDDNHSELKTGKYWTKEERKKHLERARDRKKKEMMLKLKMAILKEAHEGSGTKKSSSATGSRKKREVSPSPETLVSTTGDKTFALLAVTTV
ncbi:SLo interacting protein 1 isoform X1 [Amblyomma americanum]